MANRLPRHCASGAHGPSVACDRMGLDTDGRGFPHPQTLRGRVPTVHCRLCDVLLLKQETLLFSVELSYPVVRWQTVLGVPVAPLCPKCHSRRLP